MKEELLTKYLKIGHKSKEELLREYKTSEVGLSETKASNLLKINGKNKSIKEDHKKIRSARSKSDHIKKLITFSKVS